MLIMMMSTYDINVDYQHNGEADVNVYNVDDVDFNDNVKVDFDVNVGMLMLSF